MPSIASTLQLASLKLQVNVELTSASAVNRFLPMRLQEDGVVPARVSSSAVLPSGSGEARALLRALPLGSSARSLAGDAELSSSTTCADLAAMADPLKTPGLSGAAVAGLGASGVRLQRQESTAVIASLWLARSDCAQLPLVPAVTLSPSLVFLSAYTQDARDVALPADPKITLISPFAPPGSEPPSSRPSIDAVAEGVYGSLRGILARPTAVEWTVTGLPSADAVLLNASYGDSLPAVHTLTWTSAALASALPPYALFPGYYYTATAAVTLEAAWSWDTEAFSVGSFPPAPPPETTHVSVGAPESLAIAPELAWGSHTASLSPGRNAALAFVTLPPGAVTVVASPPSGTAIVTSFDISASGGRLSPNVTAADITASTALSSVNRLALASSLLTTYPLPPSAIEALLTGFEITNYDPVIDTEAWCADLALLGSSATPDASVQQRLPASSFALLPFAHALAVARSLDAASSSPPLNGLDLTRAAAVSATILSAQGSQFAAAASLCQTIAARMTAALIQSPLNADAPPAQPVVTNTVQLFSFRVGTRPLSALPEGMLSASGKFASPDMAISALAYSVPLQVSSSGSSFSTASAMNDLMLPLPLQWSGLNLSESTILPVYAVSRDGSATAVGVINIALLPPVSPSIASDNVALSSAVSALAASVSADDAASNPVSTLLTIGTLSSMLSTSSSSVQSAGTSDVGSTGSSVTEANAATRTALLDLTRTALQSIVSQASGSSSTGPILDDATLSAVALTVLSLSGDPLELSAQGASYTIDMLMQLLDAALGGPERRLLRALAVEGGVQAPLVQMSREVRACMAVDGGVLRVVEGGGWLVKGWVEHLMSAASASLLPCRSARRSSTASSMQLCQPTSSPRRPLTPRCSSALLRRWKAGPRCCPSAFLGIMCPHSPRPCWIPSRQHSACLPPRFCEGPGLAPSP